MRKILVVDDNRVIQKMYRMLLPGYALVIVDNGLQALERITADPEIDLVILDLNMPVLDGYAVLEKIKARDSFKDLPIIVVSVDTGETTRRTLLESGVIACLNKPLDSRELLAVIEALEADKITAGKTVSS